MRRALVLAAFMAALPMLPTLALAGTTSAAVGPVGDRADAAAYLDAVFVDNACRVNEARLLEIMKADGQSPTEADMAGQSIGTDKLIRHRWIFLTLQEMIKDGRVCQDVNDETLAISKFGGCA